jgi:hypothetical protein
MKQVASGSIRTVAAKSFASCLAALALTQLGCFGDGNDAGSTEPPMPNGADVGPVITLDGSSPPVVMVVRASRELAPLFPADAELVGVAVDALDSAGTAYVLEARTGLYAITATGAELVFSLPESAAVRADGDTRPPAELTDVAFHPWQSTPGSPSFAVTAENDGFALTSGGSVLHSFFCYFPSSMESSVVAPLSVSQELRAQGIEIKERTHAVAVHPSNGQIFAQPRTLRLDDGSVAGSELFMFARDGGQPIFPRRFEISEFAAGGMAVVSDRTLALGYGSDLYVTDDWVSPARWVAMLEGVTIEGLAVTPEGHMLVLDGPGKRLLEIDAESIRGVVSTRP